MKVDMSLNKEICPNQIKFTSLWNSHYSDLDIIFQDMFIMS